MIISTDRLKEAVLIYGRQKEKKRERERKKENCQNKS